MKKSARQSATAALRVSDRIAPDEGRLIEDFLERAWSESGLAENSLASYRCDLEGLARWCAANSSGLLHCSREHLHRYLAERGEGGYSSRSNARLLSSLRHFYRMQQRLGAIEADPTLLLDTPKLARPLPKGSMAALPWISASLPVCRWSPWMASCRGVKYWRATPISPCPLHRLR